MGCNGIHPCVSILPVSVQFHVSKYSCIGIVTTFDKNTFAGNGKYSKTFHTNSGSK